MVAYVFSSRLMVFFKKMTHTFLIALRACFLVWLVSYPLVLECRKQKQQKLRHTVAYFAIYTIQCHNLKYRYLQGYLLYNSKPCHTVVTLLSTVIIYHKPNRRTAKPWSDSGHVCQKSTEFLLTCSCTVRALLFLFNSNLL